MQTVEIIDIVRSTRNLSLPHFGNIIEKDCKSESASDVVTQIDQDIEAYLQRELKKIAPEIAFVWEEFGGKRNKESFWLVDPRRSNRWHEPFSSMNSVLYHYVGTDWEWTSYIVYYLWFCTRYHISCWARKMSVWKWSKNISIWEIIR